MKPVSHVRRSVRTLPALALALALGFAGGCSDDDDPPFFPGAPALDAVFAASGTPAAPNAVRLRGVSVTGDVATVEVAIGGPSTSSDIYAFAFDLVLSDPSVARYVSGSAQIGNALVPDAGQSTVVLAEQFGDRVVVGATLSGGGSGDAIPAGESVVVTLRFRVLTTGTTDIDFAGSTDPGDPTNDPAAFDSNGTVLGSVTFDPAPASLSGV
jgi:hypothetical protein